MIYRITTEDKGNEDFLAKIVLRHFEGFSISKQVGYCKGGKEASLCIEIDTLEDDNSLGVLSLADEIKGAGNQECVLIQVVDSGSLFV